jgi:hypothetical protein
MDRTTMKVVQTFSSQINAEIAKQKLASYGIESFISEDDDGGMFPSLQATMGVKLAVMESEAEKAKMMLEGSPD